MPAILVALWCLLLWVRPCISEAITPQLHWIIQLGLLGSAGLLCWRIPAPGPMPRRLRAALACFVLFGVFAALSAPQRLQAAIAWLEVIAPVVLLCAARRLSAAQERRLMSGLLVVGILISVFALLQYAVIFPRLMELPAASRAAEAMREIVARRRVLGTFPMPNFLAGYLAMLLPLAVRTVAAAVPRRWPRALGFAGLAVIACAFLLTQSLGALAALLAACALVMVQARQRTWQAWGAWVIAALILIGGVFAVRPMLRESTHQQNPFRNRWAYWQVTASIIREHPLLGAGLGQFRERYRAARPPDAPRVIHAHNSYLEAWSELGLLGLLAWLWVIGEILRAASRRNGWLAISLWVFVLHNLVDATFYTAQVNFLWWLLAGLSLRAPDEKHIGDASISSHC